MNALLRFTWEAYDLPIPQPEYKFHQTRKWRFDYAWTDRLIALEIEGGIWIYGRHNRASSYLKDQEKYNEAGLLGWRVFKFQPKDLKSGVAQSFLKRVFWGN